MREKGRERACVREGGSGCEKEPSVRLYQTSVRERVCGVCVCVCVYVFAGASARESETLSVRLYQTSFQERVCV